jgi:hypothetical protein
MWDVGCGMWDAGVESRRYDLASAAHLQEAVLYESLSLSPLLY